jgi:hypothetical protein
VNIHGLVVIGPESLLARVRALCPDALVLSQVAAGPQRGVQPQASGLHVTTQHVMVGEPAVSYPYISQSGPVNCLHEVSTERSSNGVTPAWSQPSNDYGFFPDLFTLPCEESYVLPDLNTELAFSSDPSSTKQVVAAEPIIAAQGVQVQASSQTTIRHNAVAGSVTPMSSRQTSDSRFRCSEGCPTVYLRVGDCRRHLKKHNGPFYPCEQPNCPMVFYRMDKLCAHMSKGHGVPVPTRATMHRQRRGASALLRGD